MKNLDNDNATDEAEDEGMIERGKFRSPTLGQLERLFCAHL